MIHTPGSVTRSRIHFQRQSKSHWNQLVWTLEIKKKFGARPKCGNFSQNSRWRLAAILKMNFAISSHLFVIKSHVIYLNILFWTCRIHFCHQNCFFMESKCKYSIWRHIFIQKRYGFKQYFSISSRSCFIRNIAKTNGYGQL